MTDKLRLDLRVVQAGLTATREKARAVIMAGDVLVDGVVIDKPGTKVPDSANIELKAKPRFVSRGGEKLQSAFDSFAVQVSGQICADVGASTGGFTDCLLKNGALKVYAIDVGYGQIAYSLREDPRVVLFERTNARYLAALPEPVNLVVVDASFISLTLLLPVIKQWLADKADVIPLIKPQFEAGKNDVGKGGVVREARVHKRVLVDTLTFCQSIGFSVRGLIRSPLKGPSGNIEFLAWLSSHPVQLTIHPDLSALIETVV